MPGNRVISADTHLEVSPEVWGRFVDSEFHEWVPKVVRLDNGGDGWLLPGRDEPVPLGLNFSAGRGWENLKISGVSYDEHPPGSGGGDQRLAEMDRDGVNAEILFPAVSGQRSMQGLLPNEAYVAIARGYNDWLSQEFCAVDYDRLLGCAMLPVTTVDDAIDELRRVASLPGIRTVVLHQWPTGLPVPSPDDDRFWAAAIEVGLPLSVHVSFGGGMAAESQSAALLNSIPINRQLAAGVKGDTGYCMTQLITAGVFDRFPDLRIAMAETGAGWVPYYIEQSNFNYERHRYWSKLDIAHEPGWYVTRHFLFGIQQDRYAIKNRYDIGVENIMWANDFPHAATDWPHSRSLLDEMFDGVPDEEVKRMVSGNALGFYGLDQNVAAVAP